jgi:Skp family chaperone for outer membrane proteins
MRHHFFGTLVMSCAAACGVFTLGGCASTSIAIKEQFGYAKREQLVDRVQEARDGQTAAKKQFESALAEFMAVTGAKGGDLEAKYDKLKKEYDRSEDRAEAVHDRIADVERVAEALFKEWRAELDQYSSAEMRRASERQLDDTRRQYDKLVGVMKAAADKMQPVLVAFKDRVLFLKHNLNARAIASLQSNADELQRDIGALVKDMEASIAEANAFIEQMQSESK